MSSKENVYLLLIFVFTALTFTGDSIIINFFGYTPDALGALVFIWPVLALIMGILYSNTRKKRLAVEPASETAVTATANSLAHLVLWTLVVVIVIFMLFAYFFAKGLN